MLLYGHTSKHILAQSRIVPDVLKHHCATLTLKNSQWFQDKCEFVGMDVTEGGTQPKLTKNERFAKIE